MNQEKRKKSKMQAINNSFKEIKQINNKSHD